MLAISIDSIDNLKKTRNRLAGNGSKSEVVLLSDPDHKVINMYGLLNPDSRGLPHPATYIIDKNGTVRWKFVEVDYTQRPDAEKVLEVLKNIDTD